MIITYSNAEEVIVCTPDNESQCIASYFTWGGRDIDDYDREEFKDFALIKAGVRIK